MNLSILIPNLNFTFNEFPNVSVGSCPFNEFNECLHVKITSFLFDILDESIVCALFE